MPHANKYKKEMGFPKKGDTIDGFKVESVSVGHVSLKPTRRYEFPTEIMVKGEDDVGRLESTFNKLFNVKSRRILSGYGNPYLCDPGKMEIRNLSNGKFSITSTGVCLRIFE